MPRQGMSGLTTESLMAELERRQRSVSKLLTKRATLVRSLAKLDMEIKSRGGSVQAVHVNGQPGPAGQAKGKGKTGRVRPQNDVTLPEALAKLLKGRTMGVSEMTDAVQKSGYKTNADNFRTIVNQALIKHKDLFRKVERGRYTAV